jgi:hypothetical protein
LAVLEVLQPCGPLKTQITGGRSIKLREHWAGIKTDHHEIATCGGVLATNLPPIDKGAATQTGLRAVQVTMKCASVVFSSSASSTPDAVPVSNVFPPPNTS